MSNLCCMKKAEWRLVKWLNIKTNFDRSGLRHNLAKSMPTPEVPEVYVTSLDSLQGCTTLYVVQLIQHNNMSIILYHEKASFIFSS